MAMLGIAHNLLIKPYSGLLRLIGFPLDSLIHHGPSSSRSVNMSAYGVWDFIMKVLIDLPYKVVYPTAWNAPHHIIQTTSFA